jgi:hypothetical protein
VSLTGGGHPHIHLKNKSKYQGMEVWKLATSVQPAPSGGTGTPVSPPADSPEFKRLERVFGLDYTDPAALPPFGEAEVWHYKVIYLLKNEQAGNWSHVYSVTVTGV